MRIRLLIVDDDAGMVELVSRFMRPACSFISATDNLRDAVEMARNGQFNLVLLDLNLTKTGKHEAFAMIRTLKSFGAAVIVISGILDIHLKEDSLAAGADGFVSKSADFNAHTVLLASQIATLHLPHDSFASDTFLTEIALLRQMVEAA